MNRFQFVADHQTTYQVKRLCQVLELSRSAFYAWQKALPARQQRAEADALLAARIRRVQDPKAGGDPAYGAPRVTVELNDGAAPEDRINHKRVARVMRAHQLAGIRLRRRVRTTVPEPADEKFGDLLQRDFTAEAPNQRYVGDITYLPLAGGGNLYLATVIDCYSRKLAGWAVADHMRTELVEDALKAACAQRGSLQGAIFHSDHGSVYTSKAYAKLCKGLGVTQSMGAVGTSADNSLAESVQRHPQTRTPRRKPRLRWARVVPSAGVPLGHALQHPPSPFLVRLPVPEHLRGPPGHYARSRSVINHHRVHDPG